MNTISPKLDAPGKGIPFFEMLIARIVYGWNLSKKDSPEKNLKRFERTNQKILDTVKNLTLDQLHKKVLVPKMKGIEDSSRFWSVAETLEHIEIVGVEISKAIELLVQGEVPAGKVDIASYKPKGRYSGIDPRLHFEEFSKKILLEQTPLKVQNKAPYFNHPWLGDFSSLQWQWLLSTHSGLHYGQIKEIVKGL